MLARAVVARKSAAARGRPGGVAGLASVREPRGAMIGVA